MPVISAGRGSSKQERGFGAAGYVRARLDADFLGLGHLEHSVVQLGCDLGAPELECARV